jgi:hypothetical protein
MLCLIATPAEDFWKYGLHYSPALLYGYLPTDRFKNWMRFVTAISLLSKPVSEEAIVKGRDWNPMTFVLNSFL